MRELASWSELEDDTRVRVEHLEILPVVEYEVVLALEEHVQVADKRERRASQDPHVRVHHVRNRGHAGAEPSIECEPGQGNDELERKVDVSGVLILQLVQLRRGGDVEGFQQWQVDVEAPVEACASVAAGNVWRAAFGEGSPQGNP